MAYQVRNDELASSAFTIKLTEIWDLPSTHNHYPVKTSSCPMGTAAESKTDQESLPISDMHATELLVALQKPPKICQKLFKLCHTNNTISWLVWMQCSQQKNTYIKRRWDSAPLNLFIQSLNTVDDYFLKIKYIFSFFHFYRLPKQSLSWGSRQPLVWNLIRKWLSLISLDIFKRSFSKKAETKGAASVWLWLLCDGKSSGASWVFW